MMQLLEKNTLCSLVHRLELTLEQEHDQQELLGEELSKFKDIPFTVIRNHKNHYFPRNSRMKEIMNKKVDELSKGGIIEESGRQKIRS